MSHRAQGRRLPRTVGDRLAERRRLRVGSDPTAVDGQTDPLELSGSHLGDDIEEKPSAPTTPVVGAVWRAIPDYCISVSFAT